MKLKKYISILAIFTISLSMVGCLKNQIYNQVLQRQV